MKRQDIHKVLIIAQDRSLSDRHVSSITPAQGLQGTEKAGLRNRTGKLESGNDHDRSGHSGYHIY